MRRDRTGPGLGHGEPIVSRRRSDDSRMKQVLITGGAGFIGEHVARRALAAGHRVRILDNLSPQVHGADARYDGPEDAEFVRGDVTCREDWEKALRGVDAVVHLAAETGTGQSMYEIDRYYRVNVQGTALLFDLLANNDHCVSNIVLASSRSVYGEGAYLCRSCDPQGYRCYPRVRSKPQLEAQDWSPRCPRCKSPVEPVPTREDDRVAPASVYAATKLAQEELVRTACSAAGLAYSILRLQNVYGEGQSLQNPYTGILSIFTNRLRQGLDLPIFEDGAETRDFVHVEDVARAILACVESPHVDGATLNVGSGRAIPVLEIARLLTRTLGKSAEPVITGEFRVGDIRHNVADISALEDSTGITPAIGIEEGIGRFCEWACAQPVTEDRLDLANEELRARSLMG